MKKEIEHYGKNNSRNNDRNREMVDVRKGFGFITDEEGVDWYVHFSSISMDGFKKLRPGQTVSFTTEDDDHGRSAAKDVTILEEAV